MTAEEIKHGVQPARRFRHKTGFADGTDYIECRDNGESWLMGKGGLSIGRTKYFSLENCLSAVDRGVWEEITEKDEPPAAGWKKS